jgi:phosphoribosylglycinamide formyltransferase-1
VEIIKQTQWAIFVSGEGSNLQALIDENSNQIKVVVCNKKKAPAILKAKRAGIPIILLEKGFSWDQLTISLRQYGVTDLFLLGFMKLVPAEFIASWKGRIINLHPSLLPEFPGLEAIERSFEAGSAMGVTLHQVIEEMDAGPIILQKSIKRSQYLNIAKMAISSAEQKLVRQLFTGWKSDEASFR